MNVWTNRVNIKSNSKRGNPKKTYCVFNQTRESFLSLNITLADTHASRLKGLVGKLRLKGDEGIWVVPSQGVHTIGVLFAVDLIYLDGDNRVIHLEESFGTFRIGPVRTSSASVLELPTHTIYSSHTQVGDQFLICSPEAMEEFLGRNDPGRAKVASAGGEQPLSV
jgi:uncharacterized membrane protein (UPF0127 family)